MDQVSAKKVYLNIILILCIRLVISDDSLLFAVSRAPRYFGILKDHKNQPMSVELSEEYMDRNEVINKKRHRNDWDKNTIEGDEFDEDESDEPVDYKQKEPVIPRPTPQP